VNIHWIHCVVNIFTVQDFWAIWACLKIFTALNIFLNIQGFWATLRLPWKTEFALKIFTVLNIQDFWATYACPEKQRVPWIHCIEYIFFTVTCGEVRGWGGTVFFKAKFASVWIEWSSINSPLNWQLAEWLLLMLRIAYHNLLHTHRCRGDSRFEKNQNIGGPTWTDLSPTCLTALLITWNSLIAYAHVYNAYSDPIENAGYKYDRQLQRASMKSAK